MLKASLRSKSPGVGTLIDCCSAGVNSWMLCALATVAKQHSNRATTLCFFIILKIFNVFNIVGV